MNDFDTLLTKVEQVPLPLDVQQRHLAELLRAQSVLVDQPEAHRDRDRAVLTSASVAHRGRSRSRLTSGLAAAAVIAVAGGAWLLVGPPAPDRIPAGGPAGVALTTNPGTNSKTNSPDQEGSTFAKQANSDADPKVTGSPARARRAAIPVDLPRRDPAADLRSRRLPGQGHRSRPKAGPDRRRQQRRPRPRVERLRCRRGRPRSDRRPTQARPGPDQAGGRSVRRRQRHEVPAAERRHQDRFRGRRRRPAGLARLAGSCPHAGLDSSRQRGQSHRRRKTVSALADNGGGLDPGSDGFAAVARSLGVTSSQLTDAIDRIKKSG